MRAAVLGLSVLCGAVLALPVAAQSVDETERAVDCLALTAVATDRLSVPDTAQIRQWRQTLETSVYCSTPEEGVEHRAEEYRKALREADAPRRMALELMIKSEAQKCVTNASVTTYERGV